MTNYAVGFAFDHNRVLLICKNKPEWQAGKLNGVGGKIEKNETSIEAMCREFQEECGVSTAPFHWNLRIHLIMDVSIIDFYSGHFPIDGTEDKTEEKLYIAHVNNLPQNVIPNLRWIIPFCLDNVLDPKQIVTIRSESGYNDNDVPKIVYKRKT